MNKTSNGTFVISDRTLVVIKYASVYAAMILATITLFLTMTSTLSQAIPITLISAFGSYGAGAIVKLKLEGRRLFCGKPSSSTDYH